VFEILLEAGVYDPSLDNSATHLLRILFQFTELAISRTIFRISKQMFKQHSGVADYVQLPASSVHHSVQTRPVA